MKSNLNLIRISFFISLAFSGMTVAAQTNDSTHAIVKSIQCDTSDFQQFYRQGISSQKIQNPNYYCSMLDWMGVRYLAGSGTKKGTDCTHLVSNIHKSTTGAIFGGDATNMYQACDAIETDSLREGDLVFFKINQSRISHVGLYLQNDLFVHATVHKGVIISSLKESYYKKYFVGCGRLKSKYYPNQ
jgi:hypothetical protein